MMDTPEDIGLIQIQLFKNMSPQKRFQLGLQMISEGCQILENRLYVQMPEHLPSQLKLKRFEQLYQDDLPPEILAACAEGLNKYWHQRGTKT